MRFLVVDTETSGLGDADQVVEVAAILVVDGVEVASISSLVRPTVPVGAVARGTHHITDDLLAVAPFAVEVERWLPPADVFVAHNAEFDRRMLTQSGITALPQRTVCTYRCAQHLFPDAPGYGNQALRYHLLLDVLTPGGLAAHRALTDAMVTAALLKHMLQSTNVEELEVLTTAPILLKTCKLPKHRDKMWSDVPSDYMQWILSCNAPPFDEHTRHTCAYWLAIRQAKRETLP